MNYGIIFNFYQPKISSQVIVLVYLSSWYWFGKALLFDIDETRDNIVRAWDFSHRYYSNLGSSLLAGGLVTILTVEGKMQICIGIIIAAITLLIVGEVKKRKIDDFFEFVRTKEKRRKN
ncbi:hypothetical protein COV93_06375 [Candidatus Woesearchaeota archaeon CG11_big_fil_rev_8_21_14_0_20_43_8]|nr:MAG: hypothetical protein COV93_06375 [Candidatus Woesearchaeota archaeon CG11_big_fil_rev_8_21_14_0_20_43_8]